MKEGDDQTLAIVSLVTALIGFAFMPLIMSAIAVITGRIQLNRIKNNPEIYGGRTLALVGFWIGLIRGIFVLLITVLILGFYFFIIVLAVASS
jgi:hypothetical protein